MLSQHEREKLEQIEHALHKSDPGLAAALIAFEPPRQERHVRWRLLLWTIWFAVLAAAGFAGWAAAWLVIAVCASVLGMRACLRMPPWTAPQAAAPEMTLLWARYGYWR